MKIEDYKKWVHLREAERLIRQAQMQLAKAGGATTPTYYKLTSARTAIARRFSRFKT